VERVATAVDPANVVVVVPEGQDIADWMRLVEGKQLLMPEEQARVVVDRRSGTIVVSGDARISPVLISQRGLTINVAPPARDGEAPLPPNLPGHFLPLDPSGSADTHLSDLLEALKPLDVPVDDRIEILSKLKRIGKLHAELVFED
jgi:flagellar P-ring protein precursor FlgI